MLISFNFPEPSVSNPRKQCNMIKKTSITLSICLLLLFSSAHAQTTNKSRKRKKTKYVIVVNAKNPYKADKRTIKKIIEQLYLKKRLYWPKGKKCTPYARGIASDENKAFANGYLQISPQAMRRYWASRKQQDGATHPRKIKSDRILLMLIRRKKGAFGVLKLDKFKRAKKKGVKILYPFVQ